MSNARNLASLLNSSGDVKTSALSNAPAPTKSSIDTLGIAATSVTGSQASAITANTAKVTYPSSHSSKLDGIATSANNYSHPANHAISVITGLQSALDGKADSVHVHTGYDPAGTGVAMAIALG